MSDGIRKEYENKRWIIKATHYKDEVVYETILKNRLVANLTKIGVLAFGVVTSSPPMNPILPMERTTPEKFNRMLEKEGFKEKPSA